MALPNPTQYPPASGGAAPPAATASALHTADGTLRVFLAELLLLPTGLVTAGVLSRGLGPEGYGSFTLAASVVGWLAAMTAALFGRAAIKLVGEAADWRPAGALVLRVSLWSGALGTLALAAAAGPLAHALGQPALSGALRLFALDLLLSALVRAHRWVLIGTGRYREQAALTTARVLARLGLIVGFVHAGGALLGAVAASLGATLVELAFARARVRLPFRLARPRAEQRAAGPARHVGWRASLAPLAALSLSLQLFSRADLFALSTLGGSAVTVGHYGAAQNLAVVPSLFALSFSPLLLSSLARLRRGGRLAEAQALAHGGLRVALALLPFAAIAAAAAREVVVLIYGAAFAPAAPLLAALIFKEVTLVTLAVATTVLIAGDRARQGMLLTLPPLLLALAGYGTLVPRAGASGAAAVATTVSLLAATAALGWLHHTRLARVPWPTLLRAALLGGLAYAATAPPTTPALLVPKLLLAAALIPAGFLLLGELSAAERARLAALLRRPPAPF